MFCGETGCYEQIDEGAKIKEEGFDYSPRTINLSGIDNQ